MDVHIELENYYGHCRPEISKHLLSSLELEEFLYYWGVMGDVIHLHHNAPLVVDV
jgi:hypothetical protein